MCHKARETDGPDGAKGAWGPGVGGEGMNGSPCDGAGRRSEVAVEPAEAVAGLVAPLLGRLGASSNNFRTEVLTRRLGGRVDPREYLPCASPATRAPTSPSPASPAMASQSGCCCAAPAATLTARRSWSAAESRRGEEADPASPYKPHRS